MDLFLQRCAAFASVFASKVRLLDLTTDPGGDAAILKSTCRPERVALVPQRSSPPPLPVLPQMFPGGLRPLWRCGAPAKGQGSVSSGRSHR